MATIKNIPVSFQACNNTVTQLFDEVSTSLVNVTSYNLSNLQYFCAKGQEKRENDEFSEPLVWIGVYIAVASSICILGVVADWLRAMWKDCYQISSKYFSLNVTSMMLITIAMKLPVDLSGSMPGNLDQVAKIGSIAFMCTILAILNPSLASMDNKTLRANIVGLAIFVVTVAVNVFIEIFTGVISDEGPLHVSEDKEDGTWKVDKIYYSYRFERMAASYIGIMILLLLISISTAIIIPSFKKTLEFKYQVRRQALNDQQQQKHTRITTVEELTQHVTRFWIMAKTGSPQFVMARNLLSYASLLLCTGGMIIYALVLNSLYKQEKKAIHGYQSDYEWSIPVILIVQFIGNVIGTVLVIFRCIMGMKFKEDSWKSYRFNLRKEKYWTEKLCEWKESHIGFRSISYPRLRILVYVMKNCVLSLCIGLQKAFVVLVCQLFGLVCVICLNPIIMLYDVLKSITTCTPVVSIRNDDINRDLRDYVLHLDDEVPSQRVVETISKSMYRLIERAKKKQNKNLLELLGKKSNGFKGVESFDDIDQNFGFDPLPLSVKLNSWSVPVITLTCIAIAVPDISEGDVKRLMLIESIDEALLYTQHVEKSFNSAREYVNIRKTAMTLWDDVIGIKRRWLENPIGKGACGQLPWDILTWFADKAETILSKENLEETTGVHMLDFPKELIAAHLMHRITRSILSKYRPDEIQTNEHFFELLCSMIADILVACFSNIPQVIMMKCHADEIEKREASVVAAVKLLGRSTKIIEQLEKCKLPSINDPDKLASIDEWRVRLKKLPVPGDSLPSI